jgi:branched-chain amino acid transport system ATP-binding protein
MTIESVLEIFPVLRGRLEARAGTLSGGERQQVALAAAMARNNRLMLVDEASLGLSPAAILSVTDVLRAISASEVTSLVAVEQSVSAGFSVGQTIALMDGGEVVQVAPPSAEFRDLIERSYLGGTESSTVATPHAAAQAGAAGVGQTAIRLDGVTVTIGAIRAIEGVSVEVPKGEMIGIIGGNGSGKTSLLNVISGYYRPSAGQVRLAGRDIRGMPPHRIAALGVARTFQSVGHVTALRAVDWVRVGLEATWSAGVIWTVFGDPRTRHAERASLDAAMEILERAGLAAYANVRLADCPYGVRKMVDLVRVFVRDPEVVLLDEPTSGVSRSEIQRIRELVLGYQDRDPATVLVVDHDVRFVTSLCARVLVMSAGKVIAFGPHEEVLADPEVVRTVLGTRTEAAPGVGPGVGPAAGPGVGPATPVKPALREGKGP